MLRLGLGRKPCRVGRKKRKRRLLVLSVFGEVEMHPSDQVPGRMTALEKLLDGKPGASQFGVESRVDVAPQPGQDRRRHIFRAVHRRNGGGHLVQPTVGKRLHGRLVEALADAGNGA